MRIDLLQAAALLDQAEVVAIPTETVYGLAARWDRPQGIERIFEVKGRPRTNPLILHIASLSSITPYVTLPPQADILMEAFWPGPLTLILPLMAPVDPQITAHQPGIGVRMPRHPLTLELLHLTGPLVAPSANRSGAPSPSQPRHVESDYGGFIPILDGGPCQEGVESTILHWQGSVWGVARLGALPPESFLPHLGYLPSVREDVLCPGRHWRHYAPKAQLLPLLGREHAVIGFTNRRYPHHRRFLLGDADNPRECLQRLYALLRAVDDEGIDRVEVDMDFSPQGLGATLKERLMRAQER